MTSEYSERSITVYYTFVTGVGIGIVDLGYERRLASHLGAHRAPSIIGLVKGRVTFFHQAVVREHLRQFVEDLLPTKLVEKVIKDTSGACGYLKFNQSSICQTFRFTVHSRSCTLLHPLLVVEP